MFKRIEWKRFPRDFFVIQCGFALFGLAIALLIQANLGTNPWVILEAALAGLTGLKIGTIIILSGLSVLSLVLLLKEPIGWGTLANILFIGLWVDVFMLWIPAQEDRFGLQLLMVLLATLILGIATAVYISVDAGAGPRDSLMLGISRTTGLSIRAARASIEILVSLSGWLLGGPIGLGTVLFALLIGPSVQWAFKLFNVKQKN